MLGIRLLDDLKRAFVIHVIGKGKQPEERLQNEYRGKKAQILSVIKKNRFEGKLDMFSYIGEHRSTSLRSRIKKEPLAAL
jgi:hypothetical protein